MARFHGPQYHLTTDARGDGGRGGRSKTVHLETRKEMLFVLIVRRGGGGGGV